MLLYRAPKSCVHMMQVGQCHRQCGAAAAAVAIARMHCLITAATLHVYVFEQDCRTLTCSSVDMVLIGSAQRPVVSRCWLALKRRGDQHAGCDSNLCCFQSKTISVFVMQSCVLWKVQCMLHPA